MKRHTRNDIGHRLVRYDFASGDLVYDDSSREKYVHFVLLLTGDVRAAEMLRHRGTVVCVRRQRHNSIFASVTP
ncbi:MAG TPA: hypothetical protein VFF07_06190 [Actinomycetota bacterium]|nr:hypothetical protein [Actinomycetota bacterium]